MKLSHQKVPEELPNEWLKEAGMERFVRKKKTYRVNRNKAKGEDIVVINIKEIGPVNRNEGVKIFSEELGSAKDRVVKILKGFVNDDEIPPVEIAKEPEGSEFPYRLIDGTHRLYCSLAAGFTHLPAIKAFDCGTRG